MFGPPGHLYVYFTYGMHWCANAVCREEGVAQAVLVRALSPVSGTAEMAAARAAGAGRRRGVEPSVEPSVERGVERGVEPGRHLALRELCSGPAKLCQALGIDGGFDGADLVAGDRAVLILDDDVPPPAVPGVSERIGLSRGFEHPWRWYVPGDPNLSPRRPGEWAGAEASPRTGGRRV
jgi:DNA-3-methyladenine glycosylase